MKKKCKHKWKEDELFACGAVMMVCGSPNDLGEETKVICQKCGASDYVRKKDLGSLSDLLSAPLNKNKNKNGKKIKK